MTNSNRNRDEELELIRQLLIAVASRAESNSESIDQLTDGLDYLTGRVDGIAVKLEQLTERVDQTTTNVDNLATMMVRFIENAEADRAATQTTLASINASIQRQDRILDYLMRHDNQ